ncbi:MAG: NAD(P)(+) transhydrogenase (Re/Si-specific) subunit beta [Ignavibacterium sp.]|jgi:NAD(P) transhydrogenase subunit beta|nr:NAD(P)(+) transhydrogenase (Re/Si-specific) subunit beta [Ignavibacterium sp.]MDT3696271.1 NAD(P)(+) transhydrogenase (Re/Si-specific) subunit beta [Ignavibacterium sp.]MDX9711046.1 NAD(P)(+) transhydrogenase (Re/Si-specific) subunit beta [Ignavibacteriaceae bacterium]MEB2356018.1 NAD(P)(+) transhydrogenase (Re/Si-specific) subunit beta [Ignavibacteriales bacterium]GIK20977.1 MAG: NAD(P) transhydrogenase subunit beta [Ignavibacteriota bacterium]
MKIAIEIIYLISSILFIFGIKFLGSPKTARKGNLFAAIGMFLAIAATLFDQQVLTFQWIIIGSIIGSLVGIILAVKTPMTGMPQMVGMLNGFGGGASTLVALSEYFKKNPNYPVDQGLVFNLPIDQGIAIILSLLIGGVTFTGSMIAFGKLQGIVTGKVVRYPLQHPLNALLALFVLGAGAYVVINPSMMSIVILITVVSLVLGVLLVLPIGGADMPVAISLLNSYSGLAGSTTGFVLANNELIIAGALVGASGIILTNIMCKAMNRSLMNVVLGGWANAGAAAASSTTSPKGDVKSIDAEELAMLLDSVSSVIIVPGYGMAVGQAQHAVRDLVNLLEKKGVKVRFAIHPVAGRMPGHMNVLLAEAQIPYDKLLAMEDINDDFPNTDVVIVIGANDVVNPAARHDKNSPIYGMPILNVDYAKTVIINKRSMNVGYAGIENELFFYPNALMYFGDSKEAISKLVNEIKNL